ncbi:Disintegrin and metalloproteinase domain-containing protein 23 [Bagarius yarrelli]|uniref:Disintegrin and metalloproteinase domain-containing protein 23 n=1 Tax=Bagarius yarrelli TaxID=175774 RepID=A0A556U4P4_BAGYA|nr:Disintegrin and metalloproteinase domain-containing protein 23 [Bagarius yarrelli]
MHLTLLLILVVSILVSGCQSSVTTAPREENEIVRDAVSVRLEQDETAPTSNPSRSTQEAEHTITYPSRLIYYMKEDSESTYHNLNTQAKIPGQDGQPVHLAQASFQLEAFGSRFILDLLLNNDLLSSDYVEIYYEEGKPIMSKNGAARPHKLQRTPSFLSSHHHEDADEEGQLDDMAWLRRRKKRAMPRNVFEEIKYIELMIVSDHNMFKRHKTKQQTHNFAKSVVNLVDAVFIEQLNTRVVLVAMEIWTDKDHIPISVSPLDMLRDFAKYRQQHIKQHADAVHLFSNVTFHYRHSSAAFFGGMCSLSRGVGVNEYGSAWTLAVSLAQSLAQNLGIQWDPAYSRNKECGCVDSWVGCIMEDTGVQHPRRFSKCSISDYKEFLLKGGGSCIFNRPNKLFEPTECGNGYVEVGEECDCGVRAFYPRGFSCRYAVNDCDISETCSGDSGQCPPNLHKQDGSSCRLDQGRCYSGECKTRENQCKYVWGPRSEKFCYEKLNTEGSDKGNCGKDGERWIQCGKHDVFCGSLLCTNVGPVPRIGRIKGEITPTSFNHQGRLIECSGGHVLLDDETDLGYVEDGTPCGPSMMCLDRPSATNLIIGSIAGAILVAAIVLGGTGWGFK